ncbi:MAG: hypothetical protein WCD57_15630, partial [Acidobacteriaceae bacterium]
MKIRQVALLTARIALAAAFLSSVADRFGVWGPPGATGVSWGDWKHFVDYVGVLNRFAPHVLLPVLAVITTCAEIGLSCLLLAGYRLRWVGYASAVLLLLFALGMIFAYGVKAPLDYSVFSASAAAFLVGATAGGTWSETTAHEHSTHA